METYTLPSFPSEYSTIHICLFENVSNSPEIRKRLIQAATTKGDQGEKLRQEVDFGFLEADVLVSKEHLLTAILTTLLYSFPSTSNGPSIPNLESMKISDESSNPSSSSSSIENQNNYQSNNHNNNVKPKTRTHNLHSEILLTLSPNNNITESIKKFGLSDQTKNLIIVKFSNSFISSKQIYQDIINVVKGDLVLNDDMINDKIENITDWKKVDKLYKLSELNPLNTPDIIEKKRSAVISAVAIKNVI
ncbi:uncharacterized protein L201_002994 [Kwoniella dendrophila CBS 6074]|uniref:EKC/KEOPS complex subunit CGI121 n=1 Tax=Kwoniella dendrophila CBS 6074 TaxID=1295534 RepID=A0AAX4JRQ5_9TREE